MNDLPGMSRPHPNPNGTEAKVDCWAKRLLSAEDVRSVRLSTDKRLVKRRWFCRLGHLSSCRLTDRCQARVTDLNVGVRV